MKKTRTGLPDPLTADALSADNGYNPQQLADFFTVLFCGKEEPNDGIAQKIQSVCNVVMYITSRHGGEYNHLSIFAWNWGHGHSRQVIDAMNKSGHSIGYHNTERLETELEPVITDKHKATPDGMPLQSGLCTWSLGIIMMRIQKPFLSECGTLHNNVGICNQNLMPDIADARVNQAPDGGRTKRKQSFLEKDTVLEPYRKKPMIKTFYYQVNEITRPINIPSSEISSGWSTSLLDKQCQW